MTEAEKPKPPPETDLPQGIDAALTFAFLALVRSLRDSGTLDVADLERRLVEGAKGMDGHAPANLVRRVALLGRAVSGMKNHDHDK